MLLERKVKFVLILMLYTGAIWSQNSEIQITGLLVEAETGQPIPYATVVLNSKSTKSTITGAITNDDGYFNLKTVENDFYLEISFIGFKTLQVRNYTVSENKVDFGTIKLYQDSQMLDEVVVRGEVSKTEFKLDKRVFNVGKDLSTCLLYTSPSPRDA